MGHKTTEAVTISSLQQHTEQVSQVVTLLTYASEVPSSYLSQDTDYHDLGFTLFPSASVGKCQDSILIWQ